MGLGMLFQHACEWQLVGALYTISVDIKVAFDALMPESVLQATRAFGVSALARLRAGSVLQQGRMAVETEEFPSLPTRQGGVESRLLWNVFLRKPFLDLDRAWEDLACGVELDGLGVVRVSASAESLIRGAIRLCGSCHDPCDM